MNSSFDPSTRKFKGHSIFGRAKRSKLTQSTVNIGSEEDVTRETMSFSYSLYKSTCNDSAEYHFSYIEDDDIKDNNPLNESTFRDLVRLCGYAPTEKQITKIPESYVEFRECLSTFEKKYTKEEIYEQMLSLCGGNTITKDEMNKLLNTGDKLNDEEINMFYKLVHSENDVYNVKEIVDCFYNE